MAMNGWKISGRKSGVENAIDTLNILMKENEVQIPTYTETTISPLPDFVCEVNLSIDALGINISKKSSTNRDNKIDKNLTNTTNQVAVTKRMHEKIPDHNKKQNL